MHLRVEHEGPGSPERLALLAIPTPPGGVGTPIPVAKDYELNAPCHREESNRTMKLVFLPFFHLISPN